MGEGLITTGQHERILGGIGIVLYPVCGMVPRPNACVEMHRIEQKFFKLIFLYIS